MVTKRPIIITRGIHPLEVSARYLAKKVWEEVQRRGHKARLITVPYRLTTLFHAIHPNWDKQRGLNHFKLLELNDLNPNKTFYHDFHNYMLPEDFDSRRLDIQIFEDPLFQNFPLGNIMYDFVRDSFYEDEQEYEIREGVTYEIPAYFKPLPERLLERIRDSITTTSPPQYNNKVVDFRKTRQMEFVDDVVVALLADTVIQIHKEYPSPKRLLVEE